MTEGNRSAARDCSNPLDAGVLADYWLAALEPDQEEAIEEHLLGCDRCGARLREVIALAEGVRRLAAEGSLRMIVSEGFLRRAEADGLRIRSYDIPAGGSVQCTVSAEDDLLIAQLAVNVSGARRLDLALFDERGNEQTRFADIPVSARTTSVLLHESAPNLKDAPTHSMIARLLAIDEAGSERLLGEYTFHHTRTLPGPGAW
jgi:hypothetical protein